MQPEVHPEHARREQPLPAYSLWVLGLLAGLAVFYVAQGAYRLQQHRGLLEDQTAQQLENIALMMQRSLALQLGQLIAIEARVADRVKVPGPFDLNGESPQDAERLTQLLTEQAAGNDDIELLGIADREGVILHMSTNVTSFRRGERIPLPKARPGPVAASVNLYVGGARSTWPSGFLVVYPVIGTHDRPLAFVFGLQSDDSFLRRIQERQQAGFDLGAHVYLSIIETGSRRLAFHYPPAQGLNVLGEPLPNGREWPFRDSTRLYYRTSPNDRITRLLTAVPLFDGEFTLLVGAAEADYLAPWQAELRQTLAATLLLTTLLAVLAWMSWKIRGLTRQLQVDNQQLAIGAAALQRLIASAPVAMAQVRLHDGKLLAFNPAFRTLFGIDQDPQASVVGALFEDYDAWSDLALQMSGPSAPDSRQLECNLRIGERIVHAVVSASLLPSKRKVGQELLLGFTETQDQYAREQTLRDIAFIDPLTQLMNRRAFFDRAGNAFAVARQFARPLAVLMIDIDRFKLINDRYGHAAGDAVLVNLAARLRHCMRDADLLARLGGEEFIVLLQETPPEDARAIAERIRASIETAPPTAYEDQQIAITISLGLALRQADIVDLQTLIKHADEALYRAKEAGRNRVELHG